MTSKDKSGRTPGGAGSPEKRGGVGKAGTAPLETGGEQKPERISKLLARAGIASRRDVERMIMEGRVRLNGTLLETPVVNATLADRIEVDGEPIRGIERTRLWLYHKPSGLVTTNSDPEGRPTVFDNLPADLPRVLSIGRLDINTEGLLLLTNDGGLSRVLELPTTGWLRRYRVRAHGEIDQAALDKLKDGIAVDGVLYGSIDATLDRTQGRNVWITMGLREGKNREIKNVLGALGLEVNRLIRISYGPFQLGDLPEGAVVEVRGRMLRDQLGPRLIDEAKANFDAPIYNAAAAQPVEEEDEAPAKAVSRKPARTPREKPEDRRERALGRLDTKPAASARGKAAGRMSGKAAGRGAYGRPDQEDGDRAEKRVASPRGRAANVWMAPGARPLSPKNAKAAEKAAGSRARPPRPGSERPVIPSAVEATRRASVTRARDEEGEWIRAEGVEAPREGRGRRDDARGFEDRPKRAAGPRSSGPREERSGFARRGDREEDRGERAPGRRPAAREDGERPASGRRFSDKPAGEKRVGEKKFGDKKFGDRKPAGRKFGDGQAGERKFAGDRPGGRKFGDDERQGERKFESRGRSERPTGDGETRRPAKPGLRSAARPAGRGAAGKPSGPSRDKGGRDGGPRDGGGRSGGGDRGGAGAGAKGMKRGAGRRG